MKYLSCFVLFLILVSSITSTKYNSSSLKNFLSKLNSSEDPQYLKKRIEEISKEKEETFEIVEPKSSKSLSLGQFRFTEKSLELNEKTNLESKLITKLPALMEGWVRINSSFFDSNEQAPPLTVITGQQKLEVDKDKNLINSAFRDTPDTQKLKLNKFFFYFSSF